MYVVFDNNNELVTFTKDKSFAFRMKLKYNGYFKKIR
jgi:hypothetical protein